MAAPTTMRPDQVGQATSWASVTAGGLHTCAVRTDATLWCWGNNASGQLGDGYSATRTAPAQIGAATWARVSAGVAHTCATRVDGTLWCWGSNQYGQLGDGSTANRMTPTRAGDVATWRESPLARVIPVVPDRWHSVVLGRVGRGQLVTAPPRCGRPQDGSPGRVDGRRRLWGRPARRAPPRRGAGFRTAVSSSRRSGPRRPWRPWSHRSGRLWGTSRRCSSRRRFRPGYTS